MLRRSKYKAMNYFLFVLIMILLTVGGCQNVSSQTKSHSTEDMKALNSVAGVMRGGKPLTEQEIKDLEKQMATNPEAKSAVQSLTNSLQGSTAQIKYCPVDGKRFAAHLTVCPEHNVELKTLSN